MKWKDKFNLDKAGATNPRRQLRKPYYTEVLQGKRHAKGIVYEIKTEDFFTVVNRPNPHDKGIAVNLLIEFNRKDFKWNLPYYDVNNNACKGLHRASICLEMKMSKIPILIVGRDKEHIENYLKEKGIKANAI
jgi:hypothetical protein